ncbi:type II toxin-antitoxin system RelE/ParE family toxin [Jiella marina]|uniref:type II toxin-antitoxin system RelE/ParE family toxin n=1 Tax=Jiella sp. LLJ827 TaxID=2917712 RepID=UPI0021010A6C|nr:type II toxin-antitoxin system RelE/ParE family toxin [Jiella sp. LLJ827]MCQ0986794.1 type II toxin-antitoxin system RelE/ParE family toxin [Jiella sp. LLJ827]
MIRSFKGKLAEALGNGRAAKGFPPDLVKVATRKLAYLKRARLLSDLAAPPGNRLESLQGNREGQHSIRINDQWRICFVWRDGAADEVEIVDYH